MFPITQEMKALVDKLRLLRLGELEQSLQRCCYEEQEALLGLPPRRSRKNGCCRAGCTGCSRGEL